MSDALSGVLQKTFRLQEFRKGQRAIIESVLLGRDTMAVMPTGRGKSLCYQLPAYVTGRLVIVISPLIALMQDQVRLLEKIGLRTGCLHSGQELMEKRKVFARLREAGPFILFLSPERVQKPGFAEWLKHQDVALFAIDEAHCVSQWGADFRLDYSRLSILRELKPEVPILALTATATPQVLDDIACSLGMHTPDRHVYGFYRSNLFYQVSPCADEEEKLTYAVSALRAVSTGRVLIYCGTRARAESLAEELSREFSDVGFYHAGLSAERRLRIQKRMEKGELRILCATNAFGMGVDYPDVRLVIHFNMPANIESFYQEMGRAGRDGNMSRCLLLYAKRDRGLQSFFIQQSRAEPRVISSKWKALDAMTQFAEGGECRHSGILTYFRDSDRISRCGHCDICSPDSEWLVRQPMRPSRISTVIRRAKDRKKASVERAEALSSPEAKLRAEHLKEWRKGYASEHDIAAFIVFSNKTLIDLAEKNPQSLEELGRVYGFGTHKIEAIGEKVLAELKMCSPETKTTF